MPLQTVSRVFVVPWRGHQQTARLLTSVVAELEVDQIVMTLSNSEAEAFENSTIIFSLTLSSRL